MNSALAASKACPCRYNSSLTPTSWVDCLRARGPCYAYGVQLLDRVAAGDIEGWYAPHSLTTVYYLVERTLAHEAQNRAQSETKARELVKTIAATLKPLPQVGDEILHIASLPGVVPCLWQSAAFRGGGRAGFQPCHACLDRHADAGAHGRRARKGGCLKVLTVVGARPQFINAAGVSLDSDRTRAGARVFIRHQVGRRGHVPPMGAAICAEADQGTFAAANDEVLGGNLKSLNQVSQGI